MKVLDVFGGKVRIAVSDKNDGNMRVFGEDERDEVLARQEKVGEALGVGLERLLRVRCGYEREDFTRYVTDPEVSEYAVLNGADVPECDGILVGGADLGLILPLADCLGLVLYDAGRQKVMLTHCGRHNLEQNGACKAVEFMVRNGSFASDIWAFLSPAAGKENYAIDKLDGAGIIEATVGQLIEAGVKRERIMDMGIDTTRDENYYSHSQGDRAARFAIGVRLV